MPANIKTSIETIGYERAKNMLATSRGNRREYVGTINRYARDMINKKWSMNGEAIIFDNDDRLLEGHHRLKAVIFAKEKLGTEVDFTTLVVKGIESPAFATINTGRSRNGADWLSINGELNCNILAGALNCLHRYRTEQMRSQQTTTNDELTKLLDKHPGIRTSLEAIQGLQNIGWRTSLAAALHYLFSIVNADKAQDFFKQLETGVLDGTYVIAETNPVYLLRERLIKRTTKKEKLAQMEIAAITIKAWNAYAENKPIGTLRWRTAGDKPEPFPEIDNLFPSQI